MLSVTYSLDDCLLLCEVLHPTNPYTLSDLCTLETNKNGDDDDKDDDEDATGTIPRLREKPRKTTLNWS